MERLFQDSFRYTATASAIDSDVHNQIADIFRSYVKLGYSPRELAHIFHWVVNDIELDAVLDARQEKTDGSQKS